MATDGLGLTLEERVARLEQVNNQDTRVLADVVARLDRTGIKAKADRLAAYEAAIQAARQDVPIESLVGPRLAGLVAPATPAAA